MAEAEADSINRTNLIINYLPQVLSDEEFYSLFATIGPVYSARIIRERATGYSYGYGFVKYQKQEHAAKAIADLNGLQILNKVIKVAYSLPAGQENRNINVYVKGLSASTTNESLTKMFQPYGHIVECRAIPDKITGLCQGIGFILFSRKEEADAAIQALNGTSVQGGAESLLVKYARKENKKPNIAPQQNYPTVHHGNGFGVHNPFRAPSSSPVLQGGGPIRGMASGRGRNFNRFSPMTGPRFNLYSSALQTPTTNGYVVFIYGIGPHTDEDYLWQMCSPFGDVKRVNVIRDHQNNNLGKGYGFVTYASLGEATHCINQLNGSPFEGKPLQVSLKTPK